MQWEILITPEEKAETIMEKDRILLENLGKTSTPILHLYRWKGPSATYGHFLNPKDFFVEEGVRKEGLSLAKRPTGGGIIFHLWDYAFSALIPASHPRFSHNTLENYATINKKVLSAVEEFLQVTGCELTPEDGQILGEGCANFCMAKPTKYDVMLYGKKIAGAAQRKTKNGFLHQGSISLTLPSKEFLESVLGPHLNVVSAMQLYTFPLLGKQKESFDLEPYKQQIEQLLIKHFMRDDL
jgi:lipoate-protein ligase A